MVVGLARFPFFFSFSHEQQNHHFLISWLPWKHGLRGGSPRTGAVFSSDMTNGIKGEQLQIDITMAVDKTSRAPLTTGNPSHLHNFVEHTLLM